MVTLFFFPEVWGIDPSPFCVKVDIYCRLAGIPYERKTTLPTRAPRRKLPLMLDGTDRIADSGEIIDYLKAKYGDPLDEALTPAQRATGHLIRRTCEESLYFLLLRSRWQDPDGYSQFRHAVFSGLPPILRSAAATLVRRGFCRTLHRQGCGRLPPAQAAEAGAADLSALAEAVVADGFAVSDKPTSYDASLYGLLANIMSVPVETRLKREATGHARLAAYLERMNGALRQASASYPA